MDYKKYPKPVIAKVQADMYQLYHQDADWQHDAGLKGKPLNDGILGPITWSWMQRFCNSFALYIETDVVAQFPKRSAEIAQFSTVHGAAATTLISKPFALWSATKTDICDLDVKQVLAHGSDDELLALVRCFLKPPEEEVAMPTPSEKPRALDPPHSLFVLRPGDFETMATASDALSVTETVQATLSAQLQGKLFANEQGAAAAITPLLAKLDVDARQQMLSHLLAQLKPVTKYQLDDQALAALDNMAISDTLFDGLNQLSGKEFADYQSFSDAITQKIAQADTGVPTTTSAQQTSSTASQAPALNAKRLLVSIRNLSEKTYSGFTEPLVFPAGAGDKQLIPPEVILLLQGLQDIEYPNSELLVAAIKVRILKAADICDLDKSFVFDKYYEDHFVATGKADALKALIRAEIIKKDKSLEKIFEHRDTKRNRGENVYCRNIDEKYIDYYYVPILKNTVEKNYSEPMPPYQRTPIQWSGGNEACGCVPKEIQTMAYGVFPYWKTTAKKAEKSEKPEKLEYDFSTFSRTAYFGLTVSNSGKLAQIQGPTINVLGETDIASKEFIREARRYGSKLDWIIEKDFGPENSPLHEKHNLELFFAILESQLLELLDQPLHDTESRLRPWLSLGLASQPRNGDGITLYFKNYRKENFAEFQQFFISLKRKLRQMDDERDYFHPQKNKTYLNIMAAHKEFMDGNRAFNRDNLARLIIESQRDLLQNDPAAKGVGASIEEQNLSIAEIQDRLRSLFVLVMAEPYYTGLDEIYAVTNSTDRAIIAPLMIGDYSMVDTARSEPVDERKKRIAYIHESFGAGAFWPMVEFANSSDGKNYDKFNEYIATHFSPGYAESYWNETLCAYRWPLIYLMNLWLALAFVYLVVFFYLFPHRCKALPGILTLLQHPIAVMAIIFPPIMIWGYLQMVDVQFTLLNLSSLLCLLLLVLAIWAGVDAIKALQQRKPNRNLLQMVAFPARNKEQKNAGEEDVDPDENLDDEYK